MPRPWLQLARRDLGDFAIHWTKGVSPDFLDRTPGKDAVTVLDQILADAHLRGGAGFIKGAYNCVCFTETPLAEMTALFASAGMLGEANSLRYEALGIGVRKEWLFARGGRPVIYQPDTEYDALPEGMRWRHCRYEPPGIDFTWEREWRIRTDALALDRLHTLVFVPTVELSDRLVERRPGWRIVALQLYGLPAT